MIKKIIIACILAAWSFSMIAQEKDKKVAVFDPAGNDVPNSIKEIVREEISSVIVNAEGFTVLERQLINKVLEENKIQISGLVDESQISEVGKLMGANYVLVSTVSPMGKNYHISCKMIEVTTARIAKQRTIQTTKGTGDLVEVTQRVVKGMFSIDITPSNSKQIEKSSSKSPKTFVTESKQQPIITATDNILVADGANVFLQGRKLSKEEVKNKMLNTDALRLYEKGLSQRKKGNVCLFASGCLLVFGIAGLTDTYYSYDGGFVSGLAIIDYVGVGLGITGFILKGNGKKNIRAAIDSYNHQKGYTSSNVEIDFGLTQGGLGLVLRF